MKTRILPASDLKSLRYAIETLQSGGIVAFPTDTVYGLGAMAFDETAVRRIYTAKDRPIEKAIPVLLGDVEDIDKVTMNVSGEAKSLARHFWPGPLTLVVPKHPEIPEVVSATNSVGVRVPDHPVTRELLRATGPLAVTSANLSGMNSPVSAQEVFDQLDGRIALILDGGRTRIGVSSTVVDCLGNSPIILRQGSITMEQIEACIRDLPEITF